MPRVLLKAVRYAAYGLLALSALVLAAVLAIYLLLQQPSIQADLGERVSQAVNGKLTWDRVEMRLLPSPRGELSGAHLDIPGTLEMQAEHVDVFLRLLPLLRGQVRIVSLSAQRPRLKIQHSPTDGAKQKTASGIDPMAAYQEAAGSAVRIVRSFAPHSVLEVKDAEFELQSAGRTLVHLDGLTLSATTDDQGMRADLETAGAHWKRLKLQAQISYGDLSGNTTLEVAGLKPQDWLDAALAQHGLRVAVADAGFRVKMTTDGRSTLQYAVQAETPSVHVTQGKNRIVVPALQASGKGSVDSKLASFTLEDLRVGGDRFAHGSLTHAFGNGMTAGKIDVEVDLAHLHKASREMIAGPEGLLLADIESAAGQLRLKSKFSLDGHGAWAGEVAIAGADAAVRVRQLPWPISLQGGHVAVAPGTVKISAVRGTVGESSLSDLGVHLVLGKEVRIASASGNAVLALDQLYPWVKQQEKLADALKQVPAISGKLEAKLLRASGRPSAPDYELRLQPRLLSVRLEALPGPLGADGGAVRMTPGSLKFEGLAVSLLDARTSLAGIVSDYATPQLRADLALSDGTAGTQILHWGMQLAATPPRLELRSPLAFAAKRLTWGPGKALQLDAALRFGTGVGVHADLAWSPGLLDLRRLEVDDPRGKGALSLRLKGRALQARFAGTAQGGVLDAILKDPPGVTGTIHGDMKFEMDLDQPRHWVADGKLDAQSVDLAWLAGRPLVVERIALTADRASLRIEEVLVKAADQSATLRGDIRRGERGPVIDARIESAGVLVDSLLPKAEAVESQKPAPAPKVWPLPITGRITLDAAQLRYKHYKVAPLLATLVLEEEKAHLELQKAQLCGIGAPLTFEARPEGLALAARIDVQDQQLEELARCLTGEGVLISGRANFKADLKSRGKARELLGNLEGTVSGSASDGRVKKFALIGNILTVLSLSDLLSEAKGGQEGFPYRRLALNGQFRAGSFLLEQGSFDSPAVGMAAKGSIRLRDWESEMTVLVAPFARLDHVVRSIPLFGYVIGGALTSVPVGVSGDIRDPRIVPLGPRAVTEEMLGIFERTLKLPSRVIPPQ